MLHNASGTDQSNLIKTSNKSTRFISLQLHTHDQWNNYLPIYIPFIPVSASNLKKSKTGEDQQKARKGIRKLWGTNKSLHVSQARKRIYSRLCARAGELLMVRNFKRRDGKDIWWFEKIYWQNWN